MKRIALTIALALSMPVIAQDPAARVAADAMVIDRVAEASKRDLPVDLLQRIVAQDIEWLRVPRADGTYEYASYERFEAGRVTQDFSIQTRGDDLHTVELRGAFIYRVIVESPARRLMVAKNRPVWVERVEIEYLPQGSQRSETRTMDIRGLVQPGEVRPFDLPVVARQATVRVIARTPEKTGYGNIVVSLVQARIVDDPNSPFADAVTAAKAIQRGLTNNDVPAIRAMAARLRDSLQPGVLATPVRPSAPAPAQQITPIPSRDAASDLELLTELQLIEDLLTGNESERREGLDRLHQLVRRLRR